MYDIYPLTRDINVYVTKWDNALHFSTVKQTTPEQRISPNV